MIDRIGVFICECGPNIKEGLDVAALVDFAGQLPSVVLARAVGLLCTPDGRQDASRAIRDRELTHVVFAGCSPREQEVALREMMQSAGLNAYLMQTANIREQCVWVIKDRSQATEKAKDLIRAAVARVRHHDPLSVRQIECQPDVLVVGAGVAGISAARTLSQKGRRVFLVERSPCIGGQAALYEDLYPDMNCAACLLEPELDAVLHDERIEIFTLGEVLSAKGYPGNFCVTVKQHARYIDPERCIGCGACVAVCPVTVPNAFDAARGTRPAVYIAYPGSLPHVAVIDPEHCLHLAGGACRACQDACPFDAVDYEMADTTRELAVGAVVIATGFKPFDPARSARYGTPAVKNVITGFAFERLVNSTGPTGGRIVLADGTVPTSVAFLHCVGSRTEAFNDYCSGVCCRVSFKHARQVRRQLPDAVIHHFYSDLCLPGKDAQRFFNRVCEDTGARLHRMAAPDAIQLSQADGSVSIATTDPSGRVDTTAVQLVVLATAMEPAAGSDRLAACFDLGLDQDGFFEKSHSISRPVDSVREGIGIAGCCQGPSDISAAVAQGQASAGRILQKLVPGETISLDPVVAKVDAERCAGCRTCEGLCPFGAMGRDPDNACAVVQEAMCRGCGICAAACPSGAISVCQFSDNAVGAEIEGVLSDGGA